MFALLPLLQKIPYFFPKYLLTKPSNSAVRGPGASQPSLKHESTASISSSSISSECCPPYSSSKLSVPSRHISITFTNYLFSLNVNTLLVNISDLLKGILTISYCNYAIFFYIFYSKISCVFSVNLTVFPTLSRLPGLKK